MRTARARTWLLVVLLALLTPLVPGEGPHDRAEAHEFTLDTVMTAFVKLEPTEAHLVVRVPVYVVKSARFPLRGREIDVAAAEPAVQRALADIARGITLWEGDHPLAVARASGRLSLPSDRSFDSYDRAVAHIAVSPPTPPIIYADQGYLDADLAYPVAAPTARFSIRTALAPELRNGLRLAIRYLPAGQPERALLITSASGRVHLDPHWYRAAGVFVALGIAHIWSGIDHLLFLLCLVIPVRGLRRIVPIITAFTVGHSLTLLGSAYDLAPGGAWFPPFVETVIAASIVYMALENIVGQDFRRRWLITGLFGLVHGFGFSYALRENLQFAGRHLLVSLVSFNIGIELGQLAALAVMLPLVAVLMRRVLTGRLGIGVASALIGHVGWHWMVDRGEVLWKMPWPAPEARGLGLLAWWTAGVLLAAGAATLAVRAVAAMRTGWSRRAA
jgi:HupE/UreJ protein